VSVFVSGRDRHYITLRCDVEEPDSVAANPYFQTYWSYVYLVLEWSFEKPLPLWFGRGLSDFFANTIVRDKDIQVGRVVPWHLRELNDGRLLPLATVMGVDRQSAYMTRPDESRAFHASAWAFIHYLTFGEDTANLQRFNRFAQALGTASDPAAALREIYGDPARVESAVRNYVTRSMFVYQRVKLDLDVPAEGFTLRSLPTAETAALQASLHMATGRPAEARKLGQEAIRADATLAAPHEAAGLLCDGEDRADEARAAYTKAVELGSTNFYAHYRHAQLLWRPSADPETLGRIEKSLLNAAELNAQSAPTYSYLADVRIEQGQAEAAVGLAKRAVVLEPGKSCHRCTLARALARVAKRDEALQEAERAMALARTASERQRAEEMLAYIKRLK
jgi:tetratricopeptide (TPR) repeat protein